jgi:hypothetical protein
MSSLSPPRLFALDAACRPIAQTFGFGTGPYLVGSVQERTAGPTSDVDVRLILEDKKYDRLFKKQSPEFRTLLDLAFSGWLSAQTGLPIDFQIQRMTEANERHAGKQRNPLGRRTLANWIGDAAPDRT